MRRRSGLEWQALRHHCAALLFLSALVASVAYYGLVFKPRSEAQALLQHRLQQVPDMRRQIREERRYLERLQQQLARSSSQLEAFSISDVSSSLESFNRYLRASADSHKLNIVSLRQNTVERFTPAFADQARAEVWHRVPVDLSLTAGWNDYLDFIRDLSSWRLWMDLAHHNVRANPDGRLDIDLSLHLYAQAPQPDA